jgi:hypothetical protein
MGMLWDSCTVNYPIHYRKRKAESATSPAFVIDDLTVADNFFAPAGTPEHLEASKPVLCRTQLARFLRGADFPAVWYVPDRPSSWEFGCREPKRLTLQQVS